MIFLKKFKVIGFKSFANAVDINFKNSMVGIVGPNGSGKSNIVDAIKWVLGEKSNKNLRGKISTDVIFHGSKDKDGSDFAQISLTFDNSNKRLSHDSKEVVVTRKLTRSTGLNEYFINEEPCRLKDITELFLDTGLAKGSLGIISQGTVQWFVEAKHEDRRKIFEDASGIGLYVKRKEEAIGELAKATENLNRVTDYVTLLDKDIKKLSKQAEKAQIYNEKKKQLMELDLIVLVKDVSSHQARLSELKSSIQRFNDELLVNTPEIETINKQIVFVKEKADKSDALVEEYNQKLTSLIEEINRLEIKMNSFRSKLESDLSSNNVQKRIQGYKQMIATYEFDNKDNKEKIAKFKSELTSYEQIKNDQTIKLKNLNVNSSACLNKINDLRYQLKYVEDYISNEYHNEIGVKTVLENKNVLPGILGTVKNFLNVESKYEKAITVALGKTINYLITDNEENAKYAIEFLKNNKNGRATFLPLTMIKPKQMKDESLLVLQQLDGFINTANKLVSYDMKFDNLFSMFLGRTIVAQDLNSAINLSKYTQSVYPVVSLDGETISTGGAITGGYSKNNISSLFNLQQKKDELTNQLQVLNTQLTALKVDVTKVASAVEDINAKINEKKTLINSYESKTKNCEDNLYRYKTELEQLSTSDDTVVAVQSSESEISKLLSLATDKKEKVVEELNVARATKLNNKQIYDDYQARLEEARTLVDRIRYDLIKCEGELTKSESIVNNAKDKIGNSYHMTIEFALENHNKELPMSDTQARETIYQLRADLERLGGINMEAAIELETKQKEFNTLSVQHQELTEAKTKIEQAIEELDTKARNSFKETIDKVNESLPDVFQYLFGGGTCTVQCTNPEDILNSGIEVLANPPGKKITSLNLLSGGEKSLVALSVLFAILKIHSFPLIILDEAESALDPANVERFGNIIRNHAKDTQFIVITHRPGTMERCNSLYGATMQIKGITNLYQVTLAHAKNEFGEESN